MQGVVLSEARIIELLEPFGLELDSRQLSQIQTYLDLLLRWNKRINLTAVRRPEECITRHFGESLYLGRWVELKGRLLDIGSGAGFPGLALKIPSPDLEVTLLEPVAKKRAFLKEVIRAIRLSNVDVRSERLDEWVNDCGQVRMDLVTARAVANPGEIIPLAVRCLKPGGTICLWTTRVDWQQALSAGHAIEWREPIPMPLSESREILIGRLAG